MYESIPTILHPQELLDKALGRSAKIERPARDAFQRFKRTAEARTDAIKDLLTGTMDGYVAAFPNLDRVDTYERELVDVLVGVQPLRRALSRLSGVSKIVADLCGQASRQIRRSGTQEEIKRIRGRLVGRVSNLIGELAEPLAFLAEARHTFQRIPHVTAGDTTIVVAGYPNVGKSSLLASLSNARPDIAPYAFTTKHANVGHFQEPGQDALHARRFQLVDTPGLLEKPPEERNAIEKQAVLALTYLADIILFVIDPTETCGYTRQQQERLLAAVLQDFGQVPCLVVETKADLPGPIGEGRLRVSCTTGEGIEELRKQLVAATPRDDFAMELARRENPDWA